LSAARNIVPFIRQNSTWCVHPTRPKTRAACSEVLGRVPSPLQDFIIEQRRILVVAPAAGILGQLKRCDFEPAPVPSCSLIVLMPELDMLNPHQLVWFFAKCLAGAAIGCWTDESLLGLKPEEIANAWGFKGTGAMMRSALTRPGFRRQESAGKRIGRPTG
jgi:hypothetical protein